MQDLCIKLKEKRRQLGLTIEEVVEGTKLAPSVIRDLEEGNLKQLNPIYLKGFVKIYSGFLGVDMLHNHLAKTASVSGRVAYPNKPVASSVTSHVHIENKIFPTPKDERKGPSPIKVFFEQINRPQIRRVFILLLGAIIILLGVISFVRWTVQIITQRPVKEETVAVSKKPLQEKKIETKSIVAAQDATQRVVSLSAQRDCFLRVKVDGRVLFEGILRKGTVETWQGQSLEFRISDGSAVYLEVNGSPYPSLSSMRKPIKSLKVTSEGISIEK